MATSPDDEITEAEFIAVIVVGILIFALLVLQIALLIYIFCRKKRCCCFKDSEKKVSGDSHVETSITCCPTRGRKSRGSVASDEYNLIREASIHSESETLVTPVVDEFVETRPLDPVYLKEKKKQEKEEKKRQEKEKKNEEKKKKKDKRKGEGEDQDDVKGRGEPAIAALKLEAILTPGTEKEHQPRLDDGPPDTDPRGKAIDHPQTGGDPGMSGGDPGMSGGDPGMSGGDPGTTGGDHDMNGDDPRTTGGDPGMSGGDPGTTGGDPGTTGGDPGTSGTSGNGLGEPSTRVGMLATEFTLPGQLEEDAVVREDPFIKGRGRSFRRPIGQYTQDIPRNLPCFSLPPKGVIRAWEDRQDEDKRGDPGEKKASQEHSPDEDLGYSEGSRKESTDEGSNGNRELDSSEDKDREGRSQNVDKTRHHPDVSFLGDPGRKGDAKKSKGKTKGGRKSDGRRGSQDVAKTEDGKGRNGRDPRGHYVEGGGPGSEDKLLPGEEGEGGGNGDGDGKRKKRNQHGNMPRGRPGSGEATPTQALGNAGPSRVIVGNDGDSGIVDLGRGDGESRTDPVTRNRNNQGGYYIDDDDQRSTSDGGYKYWPDRVGRFRGMDHYDSADSEMVPDELGVEDAEFDDENHLMRTYTGSELNTTNPLRDNSDVRKADRQRAVNLGRGLHSGAIVDTDEELSGDSNEASGNGLKTSKKGSGSSRQKKHPGDQKQADRGQHEDDDIGKKRPKEKHDITTPGVGTESGTNQPPLQLRNHKRTDEPTNGSGSRTRQQPTLQLRSQRREGGPTGTLPHSEDPGQGQGHQAPPAAVETTVEKREKMRRKRRRNRDTEMSERTLAADDHQSWNAYMEHDNFCELPSPLTIIFFDSDEDLR